VDGVVTRKIATGWGQGAGGLKRGEGIRSQGGGPVATAYGPFTHVPETVKGGGANSGLRDSRQSRFLTANETR